MPEDILGLGFWLPWGVFALWFGIATLLYHFLATRRGRAFPAVLLGAFGALSITDFCLYDILARQVLS